MVKENQIIELIKLDDLEDNNKVHFKNCLINAIDLIGTFELKTHLIIENCIITDLQIHSCWFVNGLLMKNCIIKNFVDYQMGGHNKIPIILEGNIFISFINFFDCQFENVIEIKNNIFVKGSNLLGNKDEGFENRFESGWLIENNIGSLDLDGVEI